MSDPSDIITTTCGGKTFRASRRTAAHLTYTVQRLADEHPGCYLRVIQPCFNSGVAASAGTHDLDAVLDVEVIGMAWPLAQRFLRECGWAAWYRYPPSFTPHIHMVSLGYPGEVGIYVPGQVEDYFAHRNGLSGHAADPTWHPADIGSTIFDFDRWEGDMAYKDWPEADRKALVDDVVDALLKTKLGNGDTVAQNIRRAGDTKELAKAIAGEVGASLNRAASKAGR